eukprot:jgi/Ulvmu1/9544/UM053_0033.1
MEPSEQDASRASQHERHENQTGTAAASPRSSETESDTRPKRDASAAAFGSPKDGSEQARQKRSSEGAQQHSHGSFKKLRETREPVQHGSVTVPAVLQDAAQAEDLPTPDQLMLLCISNRVLSELAGVPLAPTNVAPADAIPHAITIFQRMLRAYTQMYRLTTSLKDEVSRLRDAVSLVSMVTQRLAPGGTYTPQPTARPAVSAKPPTPPPSSDPAAAAAAAMLTAIRDAGTGAQIQQLPQLAALAPAAAPLFQTQPRPGMPSALPPGGPGLSMGHPTAIAVLAADAAGGLRQRGTVAGPQQQSQALGCAPLPHSALLAQLPISSMQAADVSASAVAAVRQAMERQQHRSLRPGGSAAGAAAGQRPQSHGSLSDAQLDLLAAPRGMSKEFQSEEATPPRAAAVSPGPEIDVARAAQAALSGGSVPAPGGGTAAAAQAPLTAPDTAAALTSLLRSGNAEGDVAKSLIALLSYAQKEPK